jgi:hypothetical protein
MASGDKEIINALRDENEFLRHRNEMLKGIRTENPTLRDQFAMAVLPAMMADPNNVGWKNWAKCVYEVADMMLAERDKEK